MALSKSATRTITHDPLPIVKADSSQIGQLLQNLVGNAVKFRGPQAPHVHVSAQEEPSEWLFSVKDDGIGIEPEHFDTIFGIFSGSTPEMNTLARVSV